MCLYYGIDSCFFVRVRVTYGGGANVTLAPLPPIRHTYTYTHKETRMLKVYSVFFITSMVYSSQKNELAKTILAV